MRFLLCRCTILFILFFSFLNSKAQFQGKLLVTNFDQLDIGSLIGTFWCVAKDSRGIIYAGGDSEVLEYDGNTWRSIKIPNNSVVRSLEVDNNGIIYVGCVGEFGYLKPDTLGEMRYVSLLPKVPKNKLLFSDIWSINIVGNQIYFQSDIRLFRLSGGKIKSWDIKSSYHRSFVIQNRIVFKQKGIGLCSIKNDSVYLLKGGEFFKDMIISAMIEENGNEVIAGTRKNGLFRISFPEITSINPLNNQANKFLKENHLYHGLRIKDDLYAYSTIHGGALIVNSQGEILNFLNKSSGFIGNTAFYLNLFNENELWITSSKGLSYYNINSAFSYWNDELGLEGAVNTIINYKQKVFAGTQSGLFFYSMQKNLDEKLSNDIKLFEPYSDLKTEVWDLIRFNYCSDDELLQHTDILVSTGKGLYNLSRSQILFPNEGNGQISIYQSKKNPSLLYYSTHPTFYILQYHNKKWNIVWKKNITSYVLSIVEDDEGNTWIGTRFYGVFKLNLKPYFDKEQLCSDKLGTDYFKDLKIDHFNILSGLPNLNECVTHIYKGKLIVSCNGLYSFNEKDKKFYRSEIFGNEVYSWERTLNDFVVDNYGNIWGTGSDVLAKQPDGNFKISRLPYPQLALKNSTNCYFHDENGVTWIGGELGIFRYDSKLTSPLKNKSFTALIRRVAADNDSVLYFGANNLKMNNETDPFQYAPELTSKNKSIRFEFSSPYFQDRMPIEYSYFLEGYDSDWSDWSEIVVKEYNNLRENDYIFHVRARNYIGDISNEDSYCFIVKPPWYRTIASYLLFSALFVLSLFSLIKINSYRLRRNNFLLEKTVKERTLILEKQKSEINRQAEKLKIQNEELILQKNRMAEMSEELKEINNSKMAFFTNISHELRTPLTLILEPVNELLKNEESYTIADRTGLHQIIHRNASRLLHLVNQILDFRKIQIQSPKLRVEKDDIVRFIDHIANYFEELSKKKQISFSLSSEEKNLNLWFDKDKIEKIVFNLLSNAFKYTLDKGEIAINISLKEKHDIDTIEGKAVCIAIKDNGIGVEDSVKTKIFDRFFQSKSSFTNQLGSGIGLSLATQLARAHFGIITLESEEGKGSIFSLYIPADPDNYSGCEKVKTSRLALKSAYMESQMEEFKFIHKQYGEIDEMSDKVENKPVILVIDDSEDIRSFIKSCLRQEYIILEADNGVAGFELAKQKLPDLIITDVIMPAMDGFELCTLIKSNKETGHIPLIMLTSKSGSSDLRVGLEKGANDYITKPFNIDMLKLKIDNLISSRNQLRERYQKEVVFEPTNVILEPSDEKFLKKAIKTIENNIANPKYDIEKFSGDMAMSQSTLYRKLKSLTSESTNNFIKEIKLKRAASLLAQNQISVSEIANMVGFDDPAYFSKSFKQKYGLSPSEYSRKDL
jgi:signal transduction histidine kinase/DNA-binding response OmpR family regulator